MDFKGRMQLACGSWCHPLTILDDHSRFAIGIEACANETTQTVRDRLEPILRRYGLPMDLYRQRQSLGHGRAQPVDTVARLAAQARYRPHPCPAPQGRGKNERFHRSLKAEVIDFATLAGQMQAQKAFDRWRDIYNHCRPHQGIGMAVPASRYTPSPRPFPERLPEPDYDSGEIVRRVSSTKGYVSFQGRTWRVPNAFRSERLAIRPLDRDGLFGIFFGATQIAKIDLTSNQ